MDSGFYHSYSLGQSSTESSNISNTSAETARTTLPAQNIDETLTTAGFVSFACHVAFLEERLHRGDDTKFFDGHEIQTTARFPAGGGGFFTVDRARLTNQPNDGREIVAIKTARDQSGDPSRWKDILLEVRALLHEPLRYHPNVVHLLDFGWSHSSETGSPFPTLVLEYADFGTLDDLQLKSESPLPFRIKQKLCYDVGRGLSILHACGIVHGDLKHNNVLVFRNREGYPPDQPYTAKLADFGGAIMDIGRDAGHSLRMTTVPYDAPESGQALTVDGIKATDTYSFGMLIWRTFIDCQDLLVAIGFKQASTPLSGDERATLKQLKRSESFLQMALGTVEAYGQSRSLPGEAVDMVTDAMNATLTLNPASRSLVQAQARLRGMSREQVEDYTFALERENASRKEMERNRIPGQRAIDIDSVGYALGRFGRTYDAQQNLPGCRPDLPAPALGGFLFDPFKLKNLLDWSQQVAMVRELEQLAESSSFEEESAEIQPWTASYHLFQACLSGFGMPINLERACHWLCKASKADFECADTDYLAKAWLTRLCNAAGVACPLTPDEQVDDLFWSIVRGHRHCIEDSELVMPRFPNPHQATAVQSRIRQAVSVNKELTGGTGMPHYAPRMMSRTWDLFNFEALDEDIRMELGPEYESCLRSTDKSREESEASRFDKIYVNKRGHGLLHYAAAVGNVNALRHLLSKYRCNINLPNQSFSETPLVCACRAGQYDSAKFLLENGADPNGSDSSQEAPLHWISRFGRAEMRLTTKRLVDAGADISRITGTMRKDVRRIFSDWEDRLNLPLTPLGRAVLNNSLTAVKTLLEIGSADPMEKTTRKEAVNLSPIELAALLTLPEILQELLNYQDSRGGQVKVLDELDLLDMARDISDKGAADPLTLHSRLVRCGARYKEWLSCTLRILHNRRKSQDSDSQSQSAWMLKSARCLCREVELGNLDIVQALLDLGHDINGLPGHRPLATAVRSNNKGMFELLVSHDAKLSFDDKEESLLQTFAAKPRTSPDDLLIARFLIENLVPVEATGGERPSPLASAIKNGYFPLADLLLANGASESVNHFYQWEPTGGFMSVLGILLQSHTYSSLLAIEYLAKKHEEGVITLEPLVDLTKELSVVHMLALHDPGQMNSRQQISSRIIHRILELFPAPESLKERAVHQEHGTPLTAAIMAVNVDVVSALLESDYQSDLNKMVKLPSLPSSLGMSDGALPIALVFARFAQSVQVFLAQSTMNQDIYDELKNIERLGYTLFNTASSLQHEGTSVDTQLDPTSLPQSWQQLHALILTKKFQMEHKPQLQKDMSNLSLGDAAGGSESDQHESNSDEMPVSLAQLTKDKSRNWWDTPEE
ncbi:hypothetical protein NCS57_01255400 [Fusarium keratoplasticum]|uniref:Uncharacterized protein n=1 Tax=Fusarium keratoplasticum TaxID=1328300 RepID=A0ACC0QJX3_9HYPO|nr:hypothetical protein NCS57_01255400 [Fusarium keratoplasticum]KAI8655078.1 hypothetical protein NCS57_01255400 [Fusarium keratoplasticum]